MYGNYELAGLQFFDVNGMKILEAGYIKQDGDKLEILLEEGERLIGVESFHYDGP